MSSLKYATPLHLDLKPSRILLVLLCFMYGGAVLVLLIIPVAGWLSFLLIFLVVLSLYSQINLHILRKSKKSVLYLVWLEGDQWRIVGNDKKSIDGVLLGRSYLHTGLVVLRFKTVTKEKRIAIVFIDSVTPEAHRKLRVRLRLQACS